MSEDASTVAGAREQIAGLEARVMELEIALSFERESREALDEVVREFAARVEGLERRLTELGAQLTRAAGTGIEEDDGSGYHCPG